jgi:rubrerythrin
MEPLENAFAEILKSHDLVGGPEYEATCSECGMTYIGEDRWQFCPVCGKPLAQIEHLPIESGPE